MDKKVTGHVLRYLLENRFGSKAEMSRQLGLQPRTIEKVFENLDVAKAGTIAFDKAICYCAQNHISLDSILADFIRKEGTVDMNKLDGQAYTRLMVSEPDNITPAGKEIFSSMLSFLRQVSAHICPTCRTWCNPWACNHSVVNMNCYVGHIAREIVKDVGELYTEVGVAE